MESFLDPLQGQKELSSHFPGEGSEALQGGACRVWGGSAGNWSQATVPLVSQWVGGGEQGAFSQRVLGAGGHGRR